MPIIHVDFKKGPCPPVEFKKRPCRHVEFGGLGPYACVAQENLLHVDLHGQNREGGG